MKKVLLTIMFYPFSIFVFAADDLFSEIPYKTASWKASIKVEGSNPMTMKQDVQYKNKKMRMEGMAKDSETGKDIKQVIIMTNKETLMYFPDKKSGMKYSNTSMFNPQKIKSDTVKYRNKAVKTGSENVNGINCSVWEYEIKEDGLKLKVKEYRGPDGFVYRTISDTVEGEKVKTTTDITDLKKGINIPDAAFTVPSDIKMMDMDNMMGSMMKQAEEEEKKPSGNNVKSKADNDEEDEDAAAGKAALDMMKGMFGQ